MSSDRRLLSYPWTVDDAIVHNERHTWHTCLCFVRTTYDLGGRWVSSNKNAFTPWPAMMGENKWNKIKTGLGTGNYIVSSVKPINKCIRQQRDCHHDVRFKEIVCMNDGWWVQLCSENPFHSRLGNAIEKVRNILWRDHVMFYRRCLRLRMEKLETSWF